MCRAVHWIAFPLLAIGLLYLHVPEHHNFAIVFQQTVNNICFLVLVLAVLTLYFYFKKGRFINITDGLIGWGDVLFQLVIAVYLSVLNYIFFYIASMPVVLLMWILWQSVTKNKNKYIPLAGFQSLLFIVFLAGDWWYFHINITDDYWLLRYLIP